MNRIQKMNRFSADALLRREAGEGWHSDGLNSEVLAAIIDREIAVDKLASGGVSEVGGHDSDIYHSTSDEVITVKEEYGIGDPPAPKFPNSV